MIKQLLKEHIPEKKGLKLSALKLRILRRKKRFAEVLETIAVSITLFLIKLLPIRLQAGIKQHLNPVGDMDYKRQQLKMAVNSHWQRYRLKSSAKEPETVQWIENNLREGDVFYDIGANVGAYSLVAFAVTSGKAKIYSFEPGFPTFCELCKNIKLNAANNSIIPLQLGLGEETRMLNFIYSELSAGAAEHAWAGANSRQKAAFSGTYFQSTPCCKLDDLITFLKLDIPNIIKMDVDGPEFEILQGAPLTLSNPKLRSLLVELEDTNAEKIANYLKKHGFAIDQVHGRGKTYGNYIFKK